MSNKCCKLLAKNKLTIAFVESASAGYLAQRFALTPQSGKILIGSIVCYDLSVKQNLLGIPLKFIKRYTPESAEVTQAITQRVRKLLKADIYVGCTGLLRKGGSETKNKPVGTFFYCIYFKKEIYHFRCHLKGSPIKKLRSLNSHISKNLIKLIYAQTSCK